MVNQVVFYRLEHTYQGQTQLVYRRKDTLYRRIEVDVTRYGVAVYSDQDMIDEEIETFITIIRAAQAQWRHMCAGDNTQGPLPLSAEPSCVVERRSGSIFGKVRCW